MNSILKITLLVTAILAVNVNATLIIENDEIIGASNLLVGEELYKVSFFDTSCLENSSLCDEETSFEFTDQFLIEGFAVLRLELIDYFGSTFVPEKIRGCENNAISSCGIYTAFSIGIDINDGSKWTNSRGIDISGNDLDIYSSFLSSRIPYFNTVNDVRSTTAKWVKTSIKVPEPSTMLIFTLSAFGLLLNRNNKRVSNEK